MCIFGGYVSAYNMDFCKLSVGKQVSVQFPVVPHV